MEREILSIQLMKFYNKMVVDITAFEYVSHRIYNGKPTLSHKMPATYVESDEEATTLEVTLKDSLIQTELVLTYTIYETPSCYYASCPF